MTKHSERNDASRVIIYISLVLLLSVGAASAYIYWPQILLYSSGNVFLRLENYAQRLEKRVYAQNEKTVKILAATRQAQQLTQLVRNNNVDDPIDLLLSGSL